MWEISANTIGTETEYAITQGELYENYVALSFDVISQAGDENARSIRWDYRQESPIRDARGFSLPRSNAHQDMLTDVPQLQITNVVAPNGGRMYVDHAHPEYSAPETTNAFEALQYDRAGDALMKQSINRLCAQSGKLVRLYKNNVDGKGASWGSHENYSISRKVSFELLSQLMTLHFVSRQLYTGSGRVGLGERSESAGFQLSQRADYVQSKVGLQTTFNRPIINTRDESHDVAGRRRFHVIVGDANCMDVPFVLKLGTTEILLRVLEDDNLRQKVESVINSFQLEDPVEAFSLVSHDLSLAEQLPTWQGQRVRALDIQYALLDLAKSMSGGVLDVNSRRKVLELWEQVLDDVSALAEAYSAARAGCGNVFSSNTAAQVGCGAWLTPRFETAAHRLEWLFKWQLLESLRRKYECSWDNARLRMFDLQWAELSDQGVYERVKNRTMRLYSDEDIAYAMYHAPKSSRAWLRSALVNKFPHD
ncbi:MAG: depupylase/deamidase Dop, partial [Bifidobacteriaceae bacterium]|nr:depupylase/deamidase Dop [Bifidobacteriaceae bacterium]